MASVSPLFDINNQNAYTGENWQKHPELLVKRNDETLCKCAMPMNQLFYFGRSWSKDQQIIVMDGDVKINFMTLAESGDLTVSALVASAVNNDNKSVVFTVEKNTDPSGWPTNNLGKEERIIKKDGPKATRTLVMSREDNRVFTHKIGRNVSYTFQVIWPKNLTRQMTKVNTEAPETQQCADPPQTLENDQTLDYVPPAPQSGKTPPVGGSGDFRVSGSPVVGVSVPLQKPKSLEKGKSPAVGGSASVGQKKSDETRPVDAYKVNLQQKVADANKASITPIKVWVQDERFVDAYKCDKVDKNDKPITGFLLTNFLEEKYAIWKREHLELDALYNEICETHNNIPLVIIAQIKKDAAKLAASERNAKNAKIRKDEANRLRQVEKTQQRVEAKKKKQQQAKDDDRSEPEAEDDSQPRKKVRRGRRVNDSDSE